jgi:DNA-binding transcriptional ArsR family regulator
VEKVPLLRDREAKALHLRVRVRYGEYAGVVEHPSQRSEGVALAAKSKTTKSRKRGKAKAKGNRGVNQALVKSLAHELRAEILAILNERMASPNELAKELDEGLSQVSYHVKVLKDYKVITLVKTVPRRGAVEHYYRATSRAFLTNRDWHELPETVRVGMSADLFQAVVDDAVAAMEEGTFDEREDRHLSWTPMLLDEQGWADLQAVLEGALEQALKINVEATKRLAKSDEEGFSVSVSMLGYEVPDTAARKLPKRKAKARAKAKPRAKAGKKRATKK